MHIAFVEIQNFRKLKACRVEVAQRETIFVGANNSGKTSAIDALILFLKPSRRKAIATTDFTLSNWSSLDRIGAEWVTSANNKETELTSATLHPLLPSIDVWLRADENDLYRVAHLLPTLDWTPKELLGVRLVLAPRNMEQLYRDFHSSFNSAREAESASNNSTTSPSLWPKSMREFLDRRLHNHFEVQFYILDPAKCQDPIDGVAKPQELPSDSDPLKKDPFYGLIKIDVITAQRGFADPKTEGESYSGFASLSTQLRRYFSRHLNPSESPDGSDILALEAIEAARTIFSEKLETSFKPSIGELEGLNYPGFSDPKISITSRLDPCDGLDHEAAVQFTLPGSNSLSLPEKYNGLGYQNLISMVFNLIGFRDEWMRVGKAAKVQDTKDVAIEPLHVVLVEEPEAHLHVQIQQVFIRKCYSVLRNHVKLGEGPLFRTQMIVSTHSPHIAHELDFSCLRYFRRKQATKQEVPTATVINLSETFGDGDDTSKFATRYLRTTHCDLFFADAAILVEGSAERMLMPHFVRTDFPKLNQSYISLLEIGGAHAHRLRPLLETLGLLSLVVTDLDSIQADSKKKIRPERSKGHLTGNTTLKTWIPMREQLDDLFNLSGDKKQTSNGLVRIAYQCPISINYHDDGAEDEATPYTFEDSLALTNIGLFRGFTDPRGLLKKLQEAFEGETLEDAEVAMFESLKNGSKAEMALELLYCDDPSQLETPLYIAEGLSWLEKNIGKGEVDGFPTEPVQTNDA